MPQGHIVLESPIEPSFRVQQVAGLFDVQELARVRHEWDVSIPIEAIDWQIGLIVGPSGSGKSTIARALFPEGYYHERYTWPATASLLDGFPKKLTGREITHALSSV